VRAAGKPDCRDGASRRAPGLSGLWQAEPRHLACHRDASGAIGPDGAHLGGVLAPSPPYSRGAADGALCRLGAAPTERSAGVEGCGALGDVDGPVPGSGARPGARRRGAAWGGVGAAGAGAVAWAAGRQPRAPDVVCGPCQARPRGEGGAGPSWPVPRDGGPCSLEPVWYGCRVRPGAVPCAPLARAARSRHPVAPGMGPRHGGTARGEPSGRGSHARPRAARGASCASGL
jgi:hypothetical protein